MSMPDLPAATNRAPVQTRGYPRIGLLPHRITIAYSGADRVRTRTESNLGGELSLTRSSEGLI